MATFRNSIHLSRIKLLTMIGLCMTAFSVANSQNPITQTIRGTVVDETTHFPLAGAVVVVVGSDPLNGTSTNGNGEFELNNVPIGRQSLEVSFLGYQKRLVSNLLLVGGKQLQLEVTLAESYQQVGEVVVNGEKAKHLARNEMAMASARTFSVEETERFAGSLGDPARMVANYAGVMTQNDSRNDIIIRGNSPSGVLWRMEGVEIANPNHFGANGTTGGPVSMVNNNLLANSDFLTGAFPAEYGNALAGAFDLKLRSGNHFKHEFTGQVGFNGFELGAEGPLATSKTGTSPSFLVNYRYSTLDLIHQMGFSLGTGTAIPQYQDLTFMVDIPSTKRGRVKLFGLWGKSYIELGRDYSDTTGNSYSTRGTAIDYGADLAMVAVTHTYFFSEKSKLNSSLSFQRAASSTVFDSLRLHNTVIMPYYRGKLAETKLSATVRYSYKMDARQHINLGVLVDGYGVDFQDSVYWFEYNRFLTNSDFNGQLSLMRAFGEYQLKVSPSQTVYTGLHAMYFSMNHQAVVEPRFSYKWQLNDKQSVVAAYGLHSQLQPKTEYFIETYNDADHSFHRTNKELKFTRSQHVVLGYERLFGQNGRMKLETYFQNLWDAPVKPSFNEFSMLNAGDNFGVPSEDSLVNKGKGQNMGLELTVERFLNKGYYYLFTASLFDSKYTGADDKWRNTAFNGNYVLNLLGGYEFKTGKSQWITVDLKSVWAGGRRYVPIDIAKSELSSSQEYDWSRAYDHKYTDYFRTDLRIGYKMNRAKWSQEWALDLQNITGYQSVFYQAYDVERHETYQTYQQGFLPMMLYRVRF